MTYQDLLGLLLEDDVYFLLKQKENDIFQLIPELKDCKGFNQNNKWHVYDVYEHILHVIAGIENNIYLRLAALFHDIGKPLVYTEDEKGIGHFFNHWNKSVEIFKKYEDKFELEKDEINLIVNLIFWHDINIDKINNNEVIEMLKLIGYENVELLFKLKKADLLAQSSLFHHLTSALELQKDRVKKLTNLQ